MLFLMLFLLGIDSEFGTMEAAVTPIFDAQILPKWMKKYMFTGKGVLADSKVNMEVRYPSATETSKVL
jgi:hypothetical protein